MPYYIGTTTATMKTVHMTSRCPYAMRSKGLQVVHDLRGMNHVMCPYCGR